MDQAFHAPKLQLLLSEATIVDIIASQRSTGGESTSESRARDELAKVLQGDGAFQRPERAAVMVDLLYAAMQQCVSMDFSARQTAIALTIVKILHEKSMAGRLTIENSFRVLQDLLLTFTVHRPPFSEGVFSPEEARTFTAWTLSAFFRLYKLHMYAFTKRATKDVRTVPLVDGLEAVPDFILNASLDGTVPWEAHEAQEADKAAKAAAEAREAEERAQKAEEERVKRELEEAYQETMPDEVERKVRAVVEREVARMRGEVEAQYHEEHERLRQQLATLKVQ